MTNTRQSIWHRKLDLVYLMFFIIHIPVMLCVDLSPLYPASVKPTFIVDLRKYYVETYRDRFFTHPTPFFNTFMLLEAVYHLPITLWSIPALIRDDPLMPLNLLVFALETAITTLVCTVEMLGWDGYTNDERINLASLYVPYLALAVVMGVDAFLRLRRILLTANLAEIYKKTT